MGAWYFPTNVNLVWGGGPEKCSSVISDENLFDILDMSEAVVKPATSMMLLLPEKIAKSNAFAEKWKCPGLNSFQQHVFWKMKNKFSMEKMPKANSKFLKRQSGENNICWKASCSQAEAWMCHNHCDGKYSGFRAYVTKL